MDNVEVLVTASTINVVIAREHRRSQHLVGQNWTCICESCDRVRRALRQREPESYDRVVMAATREVLDAC